MLTQKDRNRIKEMDLYEFMIAVHPADIEIHNTWVRLKCNTSVNIKAGRPNWQDFSSTTSEKYGDGISLLTKFLGYSFVDAKKEILKYLSGKPIEGNISHVQSNKAKRISNFKMPVKSTNYPRTVYSYLGKTRHIPYRLIDLLIAQGYVYMTDNKYGKKTIHNVVFTMPNHRFYEIRGTNTYGKSFHQSMACSENDCLIIPGTKNEPKKIYITEASIDAISLLAILGLQKKKEDAWFVALGGIAKTKPLEYLSKKYKDAEIILAVDNDKAGDEMRQAYKGRFESIIPTNKDWNEDLCMIFNN